MRRPIVFRSLAAAWLVLSLFAVQARAEDLGVRGATWPIAEPDLLVEIEARLVDMQRSGELARLEREARARALARLEAPEPVAGIAPARAPRSRLFDPGTVLDRDLRGADGTLVAARGTRIDPLAHVPLTRDLLFIDGRREVEVAWALGRKDASKIVLLAGRPLALARRHARPFFFDQGGRLGARLGLERTPSLVVREGTRLRIDEIPLEDRGPGDGGEPGE